MAGGEFMLEHIRNARAASGREVPAAWYQVPAFYFTNPGAVYGDTFTAQYELATYSTRKVIQSSWPKGFSDTLKTGPGGLISGWVAGMEGMKVGGRRELILPPVDGYGDASPGTGIAKNDTLIFIIDLVKLSK